MHGREDGQNRKRIRHMWSVASRGSTATLGVDTSSSVNFFSKDGRKITVGDCALFKPPNDSPPFVGFIRALSLDKDNNLKLRVNWLYRPAEVVLGKGVALEAAPNEVFYSFHRDETLAASLLHPCKVAFLPKGVELPSGVSSFVCRRVYDITNKCLWWLTDKDYINDRQEEVDQLLQKSRLEMHATVQQHQGTNSPKSVNGASAMSPLKHSLDSVQNNGTYASHPKGKKRELGDPTPEPMKRERLMKDGGDSVLSRSQSSLKSELTKMTDKGGLIDFESVEKIVQLMQVEKLQKKVDFSCRSMLAGIIACTERFDCLNQFVLLRGLTFLDEWLQEIHKGKVGDSGSPKEDDKTVEDFLFVLLRALDKLPVNLNALQMCNIGKSVNNLRSHKNSEIQKKVRSLVDTWKKRVELEMNMNDTMPSSNQHAPWPGRSRHDASHGGNKHPTVSSDTAQRSSGKLGSIKCCPLKPVHGDNTTRAASIPTVSPKTAALMPLMTTNSKDGQTRISFTGGASEPPHNAVKEEKSSSSSQSHTNSQCSSDHARNIVRFGNEDAGCSTAGLKSMNKTKGSSRQRKSAKESGSIQNSSLPSISPSGKFSEFTVTSERNGANTAAEDNSHKIIVKIPSRGRSPGQAANIASSEDPSCRNIIVSSPAHSDKLEQTDAVSREKNYGLQAKDIDMIPAASSDGKKHISVQIVSNAPDVSKEGCQFTEKNVITEQIIDSCMRSIDALIDSCNKYSEVHAPTSEGDESDDSGIKLDQADAVLREKNYGSQTNEVDMIPAAPSDGKEHTKVGNSSNVPDVSSECCQSTERNVITKRPDNSSMNSINALIDSCVKYSVAHAPIPVSDDSGMNLLASVATGEITRSGASSPAGSPARNNTVADNFSANNEGAKLCSDGAPIAPCVSNVDRQQNEDPFLKSNRMLDAFSGGTAFSLSTACNVGKADEDRSEQIHLKADESHDSVSCKKQIANTFSPAQDGIKDEIQCKEVLYTDQEVSAVRLSSNCEEKNNSDQAQNSNALVDQEPTSATYSGSANKAEGQVDSTIVREEPDTKHPLQIITETTDELETCNIILDSGNKRIEVEKTALLCPDVEGASALAAADHEEKTESKSNILQTKDSGIESPSSSKQFAITVQVESKDERASCIHNASPAALMSDTDRMLGFDLNEGFNMDDMKNGEPTTMLATVSPGPVSVFSASQSAISSASNGLPASVTVASAAKRPFVPPEDLLRNKSELGWKGSAATSAFRPAEPRKLAENQTVSNKTPLKESMASKPVRAFLDFDLNVKDEMGLEDMGCQGSLKEINHNPGRKSGGFELDLNKVDDSQELGHLAAGNYQRFEVSVPPLQLSQSSNSIVNGHINAKRNFDLNDGPTADELTMDSYNQHIHGTIPPQPTFGMRMSNAAGGSISSWYSPGTTYSVVRTPVALSEMSILGAPGPHQRTLGAPSTASQFNTDFYRGSVLSSSPTMNFTSSPFQYPAVFPFGSSFPLPTSLAGNSAAYIDPSSGARFCTPAVATQLVGTSAAVSSQYLRPCVLSPPDVSSNGESSQKWGRQGLDLNCGPLGVDAEGKDEAVLLASRQHLAVNSQAMMDEHARGYQVASGVLKRKDPEGGWGTDRLSYKQPPWQ